MKTKERLERAGWRFLMDFPPDIEVYYRGNYRIFYNNRTCVAKSWCLAKEIFLTPEIIPMDDFQLDLFCEK